MDDYFNQQLPEWRQKGYKGVENLHIAVMGCVVNGPGESKNANIGISLPGTGENPRSPVYIDGKLDRVLEGKNTMDDFKKIVDGYVKSRFEVPSYE